MKYLQSKFGRTKNSLIWLVDYFRWKAGLYRKAYLVDWTKVKRLVFVCKGNICRSPFAEVYVATNFPNLLTSSVGIATEDGNAANAVAIKNASNRNCSLSEHRSRCFNNFSVMNGDLFVCMEPSHKSFIDDHIQSDVSVQSTYLGIWGNKAPYIPDPYGTCEPYFEHCFDIIEHCIDGLITRLPK